MNQLLRHNRNQKFIVVDTETEGLSLASSRPWQLSWIVCQGEEVLEEHDYFIKHDDLKISQEAAKVTHFNMDYYLSKAVPAIDVWNKFERYLNDDNYIIVGQNLLNYDIYIINVLMKMLGKRNDWKFIDRILDTKALAASIFKSIKPNNKFGESEFLSWQMKLMNFREKGLKTSQGYLLKHYAIDFDVNLLHNSLYDIKMNYKIFRKQILEVEV
jgi:DNA polymerase III alpha subunit (gram-positive type)